MQLLQQMHFQVAILCSARVPSKILLVTNSKSLQLSQICIRWHASFLMKALANLTIASQL